MSTISGKCWIEKHVFKCKYDIKNTCDLFKIKQCLFVSRKCLKGESSHCALWENTYKCLQKVNRNTKKLKDETFFGTDPDLYDTEYAPSTSSSETIAALAVFDAIQQELNASNAYDATKISLFRGKNFQCARNVAGELVYDCCFAFKGLANELKLSQCNADELALSEMRDKGLCYYIGSYDVKMLEMWK